MTTEGPDFRLMVGPEPYDPADLAPAAAAAGAQATIVQFAALLSPPDIARLTAAYGLRLDRLIPNLSYLERLDAAAADRVRADFLVRAVAPFPPASKLSPEIPATGPLDLVAVLFADSDAGAVTAALTALGAHDVVTFDDRETGGKLRLRLILDDATRVAQVAAVDDVTWLEPLPTVAKKDVAAAQTIQSGDPARGPIWDHELHGEGQVIAIMEQGTLALNHCFFADDPPNTPGPGHRKIRALFNVTKAAPDDHFTEVAGIAAGDQIGHPGTHPNRGGAYRAKLVANNEADIINKADPAASVSFAQMLERARDAGATIHSLSIGGGRDYNTFAQDIDDFSVKHEEQLVLAAGEDTGGPVNQPPGTAFNTICVAAAKAHPDHMTRGSGVDGPSVDGRRKPDLMAVGCGITSSSFLISPPAGPYCDTFPLICATSYATPNAAAAAALVRQYFTDGWYPTGRPVEANRIANPTGALIKAVLLNATVNMTGIPGYPSDAEGWGLIQLDRALVFADPPGTRSLIAMDIPRRAGLRMAETRSSRFSVRDSTEPLKITFVWTNRPPAEQNLARPSVQPIRFEVEDPAGNLYLGNDFDVPSGFSRQVKASPPVPPDITNNVQMVALPSPVTGDWTIRLRPFVNLETQGYALVISGGVF